MEYSNPIEVDGASALVQTYNTFPFELAAARGEVLRSIDGSEFVDFYGGHCVCGTGHGHLRVLQALADQAQQLMFYSNAARLAIRENAAARLVHYAGGGLSTVFFCNSGSEANENALKIAAKLTGRSRFIAFEGAFHGRTLLALSATSDSKLRAPYEQLLAPVSFLPFNNLEAVAAANFSECAAVIIEPVQSLAGVRVARTEWLAALREKCTRDGALLILDEVQTGFGRLGRPFAMQYFGIEPDLLTCAKSMASGFPMGALLLGEGVADRIRLGDLGSTFGGGPLACAALLATIAVIEDERLAERAADAESYLRTALASESWLEVRGAGLLLGLVVGRHAAALKQHLLEQGLLVGGSSDPSVLRLMPPLNISTAALARLAAAIQSFGAMCQCAD